MKLSTLAHLSIYSVLVILAACGGGSGYSSNSVSSGSSSSSSSSSGNSSSSGSSTSSSTSSSSTSSSTSSSSSSSSSNSGSSSSGAPGLFIGVSLASAEFGEASIPGVYGTDYIYPDQSEVDYFKSKFMNMIRLPFLWERLQPALNQPFDTTEFGRLDLFVTQTTAKDMYVLLDPHNYARYHGNLIGSTEVPNSAFADFWSRLASEYKDNPYVIFGLMNEPNTMPTEQWIDGANAAAVAIRDTGATNLITVPGNAWTGAHSWNESWYGKSNAEALLDFVDPGDNFVVEVHQYFDDDRSGTVPECETTEAADVLSDFTAWLATHNLRGFLGEFAGADTDSCAQAIESALTYIENNSEYWIGWTWWAAGPWWTWQDYMFSLEPSGDVDAPQWLWLEPYLQ